MNLKGLRVAMSVIAAALLAMMLSGCGGDDNGLSAEDMARIAAAEQAAMDAQAAADAAADAEADAETRIAELEAQVAASSSDDEIAALTQEIADLVAEIANMNQPAPDPGYQPSDPGGTLEGAEGRAAAARIAASASAAGVMGGVSASVSQAELGQPPALTVSVAGQAAMKSGDDAYGEAPAIDDWMGVSLKKEGAGGITQSALVYSDARQSVRAFGDAFPYNRNGENVSANVSLTHRFVAILTNATDDTATMGMVPSGVVIDHELSTTGSTMRRLNGSEDDLRTVRGSFEGVGGEFRCVATGTNTCSMKLDDEGVLWIYGSTADGMAIADVQEMTTDEVYLLFKADDPYTVLPDQDYLAFGVWTVVPSSPTHANPGRTRAFVDASAGAFNANMINMLQGEAKYEGPAAGHYATRAAGDHMVDYGRFTATARIEANFDGAGSVAPPDDLEVGGDVAAFMTANDADSTTVGLQLMRPGTMPGVSFSKSKIDNFMDEDGNMMEGWLVNLGSPGMINNANSASGMVTAEGGANPSVDNVNAALATVREGITWGSMLSGRTDGTTGSMDWEGVWDASFRGTNMSTTPTGVIGRFQAEAGTAEPSSSAEGRILLSGPNADMGFAGVVGAFAGRPAE